MKARIASLVLNDNAPQLAQAAIERIRAYAGQPPAFDTVAELSGSSARSTSPTAGSATRSGAA